MTAMQMWPRAPGDPPGTSAAPTESESYDDIVPYPVDSGPGGGSLLLLDGDQSLAFDADFGNLPPAPAPYPLDTSGGGGGGPPPLPMALPLPLHMHQHLAQQQQQQQQQLQQLQLHQHQHNQQQQLPQHQHQHQHRSQRAQVQQQQREQATVVEDDDEDSGPAMHMGVAAGGGGGGGTARTSGGGGGGTIPIGSAPPPPLSSSSERPPPLGVVTRPQSAAARSTPVDVRGGPDLMQHTGIGTTSGTTNANANLNASANADVNVNMNLSVNDSGTFGALPHVKPEPGLIRGDHLSFSQQESESSSVHSSVEITQIRHSFQQQQLPQSSQPTPIKIQNTTRHPQQQQHTTSSHFQMQMQPFPVQSPVLMAPSISSPQELHQTQQPYTSNLQYIPQNTPTSTVGGETPRDALSMASDLVVRSAASQWQQHSQVHHQQNQQYLPPYQRNIQPLRQEQQQPTLPTPYTPKPPGGPPSSITQPVSLATLAPMLNPSVFVSLRTTDPMSDYTLKMARAKKKYSPYDIPQSHPLESVQEDIKRQQRVMKNRVSAEKSRQRRKDETDDLEQQVQLLEQEYANLSLRCAQVQAEGDVLREQLAHTQQMIRDSPFLSSLLVLVAQVAGAMANETATASAPSIPSSAT